MRRLPVVHAVTAIAVTLIHLGTSPVSAKKPDQPGGGGGGGSTYEIHKLDDIGGAFHNGQAYDVSNFGEIVGYVDDAVGGTGRYAAYWTIDESSGQVQTTLSLLAQGIAATGVNDAGGIVGQGEATGGALVGMYWAGPDADPIVLEPLPGHDRSHASAINLDGLICGTSGLSGQSGGGSHTSRAVAWRVNQIGGSTSIAGPFELPGPIDGSRAYSLNDGDSDGVANIAGVFHDYNVSQTAVVWVVQSQADASLAVAPAAVELNDNAEALGINNADIVCGHQDWKAVLWSGPSRATLHRPTKGRDSAALTVALAISNSGVVVGYGGPGLIDRRAVVWENAGAKMVYLDSFLNGSSPLRGLSDAQAVNEFGVIVGKAWDAGFIAMPKP